MSAGLALLVETGVFTLRDVFGNLAETFFLGSSLITVLLLLFYAATGYSPANVRAQIKEVFKSYGKADDGSGAILMFAVNR